jgi:hypothetical protein
VVVVIEEVVDHIGKLTDMVNSDKWKLAEAVHDAYSEFPSHTQNLTSALSQRCKLSTTQLYNLRDAWELRSWFGEVPLSVSHYGRMHTLSVQLNLSPGDISQYFELAVEEGWSVSKMVQEVTQNHMDNSQKEKITYCRWLKTMRKIWQYSMFNALPKDVREAYYKLMRVLEEAGKQ